MHYPVEIILQRLESSIEIETQVFAAIDQLAQHCDHILGCQVFIRGPGASDEGLYTVSLKVRLPDAEVTIAGGRRANPKHRELGAALRDAFAQAAAELHLLNQPMCSCKGAADELHA